MQPHAGVCVRVHGASWLSVACSTAVASMHSDHYQCFQFLMSAGTEGSKAWGRLLTGHLFAKHHMCCSALLPPRPKKPPPKLKQKKNA